MSNGALRIPEDLAAWQAWHARRRPVHYVRGRLRPQHSPSFVLHRRSSSPSVLVVLDSASASNRSALLGCMRHLGSGVAVLAPTGLESVLPGSHWRTDTLHEELPDEYAVVLAAGHFTNVQQFAWRTASKRGTPFLVAQHGLMTPLAPPLPPDAHLLAWSAVDAEFWWSGRDGPATVVGSQLIWDAASSNRTHVEPAGGLVYLGQLHGAELPRRRMAAAAEAFCLEHDAVYRPHPSETDRLSRWQHQRWERHGVTIDRSRTPLRETTAPVVSVFSTGVLEAAARGVPAWVDYPDPPAWLREFWQRYDLRPYGADPTPAPPRPDVEPAVAVADVLRSYL